jgi:hypothetical protein
MKGVSKTRGMGLQDEKMKPGKTMKAMYGKMATMKTGKMAKAKKEKKNKCHLILRVKKLRRQWKNNTAK